MADDSQIDSFDKGGYSFRRRVGQQYLQAVLSVQALQAHREATSAELMLITAKEVCRYLESIHAYVTTCHNLADNLVKLGYIPAAETTVHQVVDLMYAPQYSQCLCVGATDSLNRVSSKTDEFDQHLGQPHKAHRFFEQATAFAQKYLSQMQPQSLSV